MRTDLRRKTCHDNDQDKEDNSCQKDESELAADEALGLEPAHPLLKGRYDQIAQEGCNCEVDQDDE